MIRNRVEAMQAALATEHNTPGFCQGQTRAWYLAPSVGDFDGDGAADAEDGWKSEPEKWKHRGDRTPPAGVPLSFTGGSHDNGHRAVSLPGGRVRSTDFSTQTQRYSKGEVGTANSIHAVEVAMGVTYVGWSESIDGHLIPLGPPPTRGARVDEALQDLREAERREPEGTRRDNILDRSIAIIRKIPFLNRR